MEQRVGDIFSAACRADLHCHSIASNRPTEALLSAIQCPESYSEPQAVYQQARRRGMAFITITDHDSIDAALTLADRHDFLVGEELTCFFPEDGCKLHLLVWGIDPQQHQQLRNLRHDIYRVAEFVEAQRIAHAVAHPIYRQNDKLERWHLERLLLLFKGFECLNGAHSPLHRESFEPLLDKLTPDVLAAWSQKHGLPARWPEPHLKSRTGGSDDHGLLNVGRAWTEFPEDVRTAAAALEALRTGRCRPGGQAGSSIGLAHTFYSVAVRYYTRHILGDSAPNTPAMLLQALVGERPAPTKVELAWRWIRSRSCKLVRALVPPILLPQRKKHIPELRDLFVASAKANLRSRPHLWHALAGGLPPLGEHEAIFDFASAINRDVSRELVEAIDASIEHASFTGLFNTISGILAQQFVLLPYYFAFFHQNKERHLLRDLTGFGPGRDGRTLRVGLFTDTLDEVNGVARFIRNMANQADRQNMHLVVHTCSGNQGVEVPGRRNFQPLIALRLPFYEELPLNIPPLLEIMHHADQQQFDAIHISTPGPMGLVGLLVSRMLRVPMLATYHTDFPAYANDLTRDHRIVRGTTAYMRMFYQQAVRVFARSREYRASLAGFGIASSRIGLIHPSVDTDRFSPRHTDPSVFQQLGILQPRRLLYVGRISREKNLPLLIDVFKALCALRKDVALVLAGDGPFREQMQRELRGLPAFFLGAQSDEQLARLYASSDLFVFPSRTDTLGQVVMEAQASGLPAIVSNEGGPQEIVRHEQTGLILRGTSDREWVMEIDRLLDAPARLSEMKLHARESSLQCSLQRTFDAFWNEHVQAVLSPRSHAHIASPYVAAAPR